MGLRKALGIRRPYFHRDATRTALVITARSGAGKSTLAHRLSNGLPVVRTDLLLLDIAAGKIGGGLTAYINDRWGDDPRPMTYHLEKIGKQLARRRPRQFAEELARNVPDSGDFIIEGDALRHLPTRFFFLRAMQRRKIRVWIATPPRPHWLAI